MSVDIQTVSENLESEDILELTNAGVYPITVADSFMVDLWSQALGDIQPRPDLALETGTRIAWAIRKNSPRLKGFLNDFVKKNRQGTVTGNVLIGANAAIAIKPRTAIDAVIEGNYVHNTTADDSGRHCLDCRNPAVRVVDNVFRGGSVCVLNGTAD